MSIDNICSNVVGIAFGKLEVPEEENGDHQAKYRGHVLEFESQRSHGAVIAMESSLNGPDGR